jgi:hypothetical protein
MNTLWRSIRNLFRSSANPSSLESPAVPDEFHRLVHLVGAELPPPTRRRFIVTSQGGDDSPIPVTKYILALTAADAAISFCRSVLGSTPQLPLSNVTHEDTDDHQCVSVWTGFAGSTPFTVREPRRDPEEQVTQETHGSGIDTHAA